MKRALAERAKQSGLPNGVVPSTPAMEKPASTTTSTETKVAPQKPVPVGSGANSSGTGRNNNSSSTTTPSSRSNSNSNSTTSPRPKKRLRESVVKLEEEDEDDSNASAFYLRHQNRALASELRQLKYGISCLERERDARRSECAKALLSVNALQATWSQLEVSLQSGNKTSTTKLDSHNNAVAEFSSNSESAPMSTGSGSSVEFIGALLDSLSDLRSNDAAKSSRIKQQEDGDSTPDEEATKMDIDGEDPAMDPEDAQQLQSLRLKSENVSSRANLLQGWILSMLQKMEATTIPNEDSVVAKEAQSAQQQVARLKAKNKALKAQLAELARARDELAESDKRVRRGLYRLAAGRVQLKEVLKAIVTSDGDKEAAAAWAEATPPTVTSAIPVSSATATTTTKTEANGETSTSTTNTAEVTQLRKKIDDLEQITKAREEHIAKLLSEREDQMKRINDIVLSVENRSTNLPKDDEVKRTDLYASINGKLLSAQRKTKEMEERETRLRKEWAEALATAEAAQKAVEDMHTKHMKRWNEIAAEVPEIATDNGKGDGDEKMTDATPAKTKAEEIIRLEHKLTQALENVRQAEGTRNTLREAVIMNDSLQSKLEELKGKYTALQEDQGNGNASTPADAMDDMALTPKGKTPPPPATPSEKVEKAERSDKSADKLHREYRRVQKQLAAATASKESAKAKLEKSEKEREALNSVNSRLLKQATEKDEMNAKSLSTILHLKQLTDQITKEKENLEQQVKSSQQLSLSARLAANARERLLEEIEKEKKSMVSIVEEWEQKCKTLAEEKDQIEGKLSKQRSKMSGLLKDIETAKGRCTELVSESTKVQQEKQQMMESLAIANKESMEAAKLTERLAKSTGGGLVEGFTAEQLHTQVKHLKHRLSCPVCNVRDKKVILLRCRHMFCKNCVDENIKNRSRKCPACGVRFDTKDVGDIWL